MRRKLIFSKILRSNLKLYANYLGWNIPTEKVTEISLFFFEALNFTEISVTSHPPVKFH